MTEPYVAEFVQPKTALKMPQPPPPFRSGLQHLQKFSTDTQCSSSHETYVDMPDTFINVIRARAIPELCSVAADDIVPLLLFEIPNCSGEEAGRHEIQETRRDDKEDLQLGGRAAPLRKSTRHNCPLPDAGNSLVQEITDESTDKQANNRRKRHGARRGGEGDAGDEDDSLDTFPKNSDEREDEHGILLGEVL